MKEMVVNFTEECIKLTDLFIELEKIIKKKCEAVGIKTDKDTTTDEQIRELSKKNNVVRKYLDDLLTIKKVRNINSHDRNNKTEYVVCPNPEMNIRLKRIIDEIENPPPIYGSEICIKRQSMYTKTKNDTIESTIRDMVDKTYTYVPILENGVIIGVFSESTLLDIINKDGIIDVDKDTTFSEIFDYLKIENHSTEEFDFVSRNTSVYDVEDKFKDYFKRQKRLGCIYITENGRSSEKVLGMLTAWDVLGH